MQRLLIIRFSALGDVAMTVPVVHSLAKQYPDLRISVLTKKMAAPLFSFAPSNVEAMGVDLKQFDGLSGLNRLYKQLKERNFDAVADFHDVLRSKFLRTRFRLAGKKVAVIDKGRKEKQQLMGHGMDAEPLISGTERYAAVLEKLELPISIDFDRAFNPRLQDYSAVEQAIGRKTAGERWVGIAPFAAHDTKVYPLKNMRRVAETLAQQGCRVLLFGAGQQEKDILESWQATNITSVCGLLGGLHNEMLLMARLDAMLAMDSANMHIAALCGTPVVSIWGATHPKAGFAPYHQPLDNIISQDDLPCRPCSVYGNKACKFGDNRCLTGIAPETIVEKTLRIATEKCLRQQKN